MNLTGVSSAVVGKRDDNRTISAGEHYREDEAGECFGHTWFVV